MKMFLFLLFSSISSIVFAQSGTLVMDYKPMQTSYEMTTCIALQFSPIIKDTANFDLRSFVKDRLSLYQFYYYSKIAWGYNDKYCYKHVDVRFQGKDYTFSEFRKLIYE